MTNVPGWAGFAQKRKTNSVAPKTSGMNTMGIGPVDPYDPQNPLNSPAPGNAPTTAPYQKPGGGNMTWHGANSPLFVPTGGNYSGGYPYFGNFFGSGSPTVYPTYAGLSGYPHGQPTQGNWTPWGGYQQGGGSLAGGTGLGSGGSGMSPGLGVSSSGNYAYNWGGGGGSWIPRAASLKH